MAKIYFASDAHLGARFHSDPLAVEQRLVRWLDQIKADATEVWFLGDMFDYWYEYKYVVPKGHARFLGKLAELSDAGIQNTSGIPKSHRTSDASTNTASTAYRTPDTDGMQASSSPARELPDIMLENNPFSIDRPFDIDEAAGDYPSSSRARESNRPRGRFQK